MVESILGNLHCLLHADDTLVTSTNRDLFQTICNILVHTIHHKKLVLNYKKSAYMIINAKEEDIRCDLKLEDGWLYYKKRQKHLGVIITDSRKTKYDIAEFLEDKNKEVNIKLANFMRKNSLAPINVKFKVLKSCVNSALTLAVKHGVTNIEILQRKALKILLNIKYNTHNEIMYVESGFKPLEAMIYKCDFFSEIFKLLPK